MLRAVAPVLMALALSSYAFSLEAETDARRDIVFLYVMSYDNNLDACADIIGSGLRAGVTSDHVAVAVLMDRLDHDGLQRLVFTKGGDERTVLESEDLTSTAVLAEFLGWASAHLPARKYALVFLDHGGRLDEMCLDVYTGAEGKKRQGWLSAVAVGDTLRAWSEGLEDSRLELLFLQQCGRGSIENLYNFRDVAPFVLASQMVVGAPNTYYTKTVSWAGARKNAGELEGDALARKIMDTDEHYTDYVLVDGTKLASFPERAGPFVEAVLAAEGDLTRPQSTQPCFATGGEENHDLVLLTSALAAGRDAASRSACRKLGKWIEDDLVLRHQLSGSRAKRVAGSWCGISMHLPRSETELERYAHLPLYRDTPWGKLAVALAQAK